MIATATPHDVSLVLTPSVVIPIFASWKPNIRHLGWNVSWFPSSPAVLSWVFERAETVKMSTSKPIRIARQIGPLVSRIPVSRASAWAHGQCQHHHQMIPIAAKRYRKPMCIRYQICTLHVNHTVPVTTRVPDIRTVMRSNSSTHPVSTLFGCVYM